ncbi:MULTISPECIES: TOBE domain-containing protein [unclassified Mesorhizobium]|uniref:TOBE domain-containing protein n=1 Tax=unclassified Mesorhizobium TaxID=325217 RepID=UPI001FDFFDDA|nr:MULTISPECIES: TOBE domain-containing protein [unclassified Mesorhizobium]
MATTRILEWLGRLYVGLLLAFLYLPIIMALMSFNVSPLYQPPFEWTTEWYASLWQNDQLIAATWNSIEIAVITTIISTVLGSAASLALFRHEFRGKKFLQALLFPPIAIPWLITGTAMLIFFFGVGRGLFAILLGHVALARGRLGRAARAHPHCRRCRPVDAANVTMLEGQVSKRIFAGNNSTYFVERAGQTLKVIVQNTGADRLAEGQDVVLRWSPDSTVLIGG